MKLAVLAARVDAVRQIVEQRLIEAAAGKRRRQFFQIDHRQMRLDAGRDHFARQSRRSFVGLLMPDRKHRRHADAVEFFLAPGAQIGQKQIAENHMRDALRFAQPAIALAISRS